jgi:hypothetical protein
VLLFQSPKFTSLLHSQVVGSRETALETILVLRQVVSKARFSNIDQLVEIIRSVGRKLVDAQPKGTGEPLRACAGSKVDHYFPCQSTRWEIPFVKCCITSEKNIIRRPKERQPRRPRNLRFRSQSLFPKDSPVSKLPLRRFPMRREVP